MYLYCHEGNTVKYNLILRESPSANPKGLSKGSGCMSLYIPTQVTILKFSFTLNGSAAAVAYAAVTAVAADVDGAVAVQLDALVE